MLWSDGELEPDEAEGKMDDPLIVKRMFLRMLVFETSAGSGRSSYWMSRRALCRALALRKALGVGKAIPPIGVSSGEYKCSEPLPTTSFKFISFLLSI